MKPHLTEKSYLLATAVKPAYTFVVDLSDTGTSIVRHIKEVYGKDVIDVRYVANAAKTVKRKNIKGTTAKRRKAIVTLKAGQTLAAFDVPSAEQKEPTQKEKQAKE